jgi:hypothetical protein
MSLSSVDLLVEGRSGSASTTLLLRTPSCPWIKVPYPPPHGRCGERHGVVGGDIAHGKSEGANTASSSSLAARHSRADALLLFPRARGGERIRRTRKLRPLFFACGM